MEELASIIKRGGVVAFPTETVYGLGADAWNPDAVASVFILKGRPSDNPLIVHLADAAQAEDFAAEIPPDAEILMNHFWPGPLTLIFKKKPEVPDIVTAGLPSVALRIPRHTLTLSLIRTAGPLVGPSANKSGKPSPTTAAHVREDFGPGFPVLDGGACGIGLESTVLDISKTPYIIYRPGAVNAAELEKLLGKPVRYLKPGNQKEETPPSPGLKYTHYKPEAEVFWLRNSPENLRDDTLYVFHALKDKAGVPAAAENVINYRGNYSAMARELYDRFRQADKAGYRRIGIQPFPNSASGGDALMPALINRIGKAIGYD